MGSPHTLTGNFDAWKIQKCWHGQCNLIRKRVYWSKNIWLTIKLSIPPDKSSIKTVSLQLMFDKSKYLLQKKGLIVLKSNATDGSVLCASSANNVKCDRTWVNINSNIWKHVLEVAAHIDLLNELQKPPSSVALRKISSENIISKFTGEHPCWKGISIKLQSNFIEITLRHGCYPVNLLYIFRAPFLQNTSGELLLKMVYLIESLYSVMMQSFTPTHFIDLCCSLERTETSPSEALFD